MPAAITTVPAAAPTEAQLVREACGIFNTLFGRDATVAAAAPGRCNIIGEHTDYNDGFVFPVAISRSCVMVAAPRSGTTTKVVSRIGAGGVLEECTFPSDPSVITKGTPAWGNYVRGVVAQFKGYDVPAFDAVIVSSVPIGGGLSSSASIEVATLLAVEQLVPAANLSPSDKALWCQRAEHDFAGCPCGIMDQFASLMGKENHALLIDCRTLEATHYPLHDPDIVIFITNSNVKHELIGSEYAERRQACERACARIAAAAGAGRTITKLRDVTPAMLEQHRGCLDDVAYRRARHVVTEDERTTRAAQALLAGDHATVGRLMYESHASLARDFEVSTCELDQLVDIARGVPGVLGSRMTGGGFGGCTVTLCRAQAVPLLRAAVCAKYDGTATMFATRPAQGAHPVCVTGPGLA